MWRRFSPQLRALTGRRSAPQIPHLGGSALAPVHSSPAPVRGLSRFFSTEAGTTVAKVEDVMPIATGHKREEIEAELEGRKRFDMDAPCSLFGTKFIIGDCLLQGQRRHPPHTVRFGADQRPALPHQAGFSIVPVVDTVQAYFGSEFVHLGYFGERPDFQFFNTKRLSELYEKEVRCLMQAHQKNHVKDTISDGEKPEEEQEEKDLLLEDGFSTWVGGAGCG